MRQLSIESLVLAADWEHDRRQPGLAPQASAGRTPSGWCPSPRDHRDRRNCGRVCAGHRRADDACLGCVAGIARRQERSDRGAARRRPQRTFTARGVAGIRTHDGTACPCGGSRRRHRADAAHLLKALRPRPRHRCRAVAGTGHRHPGLPLSWSRCGRVGHRTHDGADRRAAGCYRRRRDRVAATRRARAIGEHPRRWPRVPAERSARHIMANCHARLLRRGGYPDRPRPRLHRRRPRRDHRRWRRSTPRLRRCSGWMPIH